MNLQLLGVAYYHGYEEHELRAVCFSTWSHFNPDRPGTIYEPEPGGLQTDDGELPNKLGR